MYLNLQTLEYPLTAAQVIAQCPNVSFPVPFQLPPGYVQVVERVPPEYNEATHKLVELAPEETAPQTYKQVWSVVPLSQAELDGRAAAAAAALAQAKAAKGQEINTWRLQANRSTFTHAGKLFACDELSRSDIDGTNGYVSLMGVMPPDWPGAWKAIDNTYLPISTVAGWREFYTAMYAEGAANFMHAQELKAQLAAATTLAQVAAITW